MKHETESAPRLGSGSPLRRAKLDFASKNKEKDINEILGGDETENTENDSEREAEDNKVSKVGEENTGQQINFKKAMGVAGVFICGIGILVFGVVRIKNIIVLPFESYNPNLQMNANAPNTTNDTNDADEVALLKSKDTDGDGINDYDEIYVYGTSAYIEDTDSDGFSDFEELQGGEDPLCPRGQECYIDTQTDTDDEQIAADNGFDDVDVLELRRMLAEAGMDEETLGQIDDATLLEMYRETVAEIDVDSLINTNQNTNVTNYESDTDIDMEELENLSVEQIRALLVEAGADAEMLEQIDDETLRAIYLETLGEME